MLLLGVEVDPSTSHVRWPPNCEWGKEDYAGESERELAVVGR